MKDSKFIGCIVIATAMLVLLSFWNSIIAAPGTERGSSLSFSPPSSQSQGLAATSVEFVGHIGGYSYAVATQGDYAYVGFGTELAVLDISDPAVPVRVGYVILPDIAQSVAVTGTYAYVACKNSGLRVIDVSDPTAPVEVGYYRDGSASEMYDVTIVGDYAYTVGTGGYPHDSGWLRVIDVRDPAAPNEVGYSYTWDGAWGLTVANDYAYVAADGAGLIIIDVSEPMTPTRMGSYETPGKPRRVVVSGTYAYIADNWVVDGGLAVVDVREPLTPTLVSSYDTPRDALGIAIVDDYVYVGGKDPSHSDGWMQVIDVSEPLTPTLAGSYTALKGTYDVAVMDGHVCLADYVGGLHVLDVSAPDALTEVGAYLPPTEARELTLADDYVYVADREAGLKIVDISDPALPAAMGACATSEIAASVAVSGSYAYVEGYSGHYDTWLRVIDVSAADAPTVTAFLDIPGGLTHGENSGIAVEGHHAYLTVLFNGVHAVEVSDPLSPTLAGYYPHPDDGKSYDLAAQGSYIYVATRNTGLRVVDVTDPTAPVEVGACGGRNLATSVVVSGTYAYVANTGSYGEGLQIIDVSEPITPTEVGFYATWDDVSDVAVAGKYAAIVGNLGGGSDGLSVLDVSEPITPVQVASYYPFLTNINAVAMANEYIYVADGGAGLYILKVVETEPTPTPTATETNTPTSTATDTPTATPTATATDTPTATPTPTPLSYLGLTDYRGLASNDVGTELFLGRVVKEVDGWNSVIVLQNTTDSYVNGALSFSNDVMVNFSISARGAYHYDLAAHNDLPGGFDGTATVSANQPLAAVVREVNASNDITGITIGWSYEGGARGMRFKDRGKQTALGGSKVINEIELSEVASYAGVSVLGNTIYAPFIQKNARDWYSIIFVQNTASVPADVTIRYYDMDGRVVHTMNETLPGGATFSYDTMEIALPNGFEGSATISANQPLAVVVQSAKYSQTGNLLRVDDLSVESEARSKTEVSPESLNNSSNLTITKIIGSLRPVDVVNVLDMSGSMSENWGAQTRIEAAKNALIDFNNMLRPGQGDQVGLVIFGPQTGVTDTYTMCERGDNQRLHQGIMESDLINDVESVNAQIESLSVNLGSPTSLGAGIISGTLVVTGANHNPDSMPVLIIASDGVANVTNDGRLTGGSSSTSSWDPDAGEFDPTHCNYWAEMDAIAAAAEAKEQGIRVFAIAMGVIEGEDFAGEPVLRRVASEPDTQHYFTATSSAQLSQIYEQIKRITEAENRVAPGDLITYTISYQNTGDTALTGVVITDVVPENTQFVDATGDYVVDAETITWNIAELAPGTDDTVNFVVQVDNPLPARTTHITNAAYGISSVDDAGVLGEPVAIEVDAQVALTVSKRSQPAGDWHPGDFITYTIHYTNAGDIGASDVRITEYLPEHTGFITASTATAPFTVTEQAITIDVGTLPGGGATDSVQVVMQIDVQVSPSITMIENLTCTLESAESELIYAAPIMNSLVPYPPDLQVTKIADRGGAMLGEVVRFTIYYTNAGAGIISGVVLTETLPDRTSIVAGQDWQQAGANNLYTLGIGELQPGEIGQTIIEVSVDNDAAEGQVQNQVRIGDDGLRGADIDDGDNVASASLSIWHATPTTTPTHTPTDTSTPTPTPTGTLVPTDTPTPTSTPVLLRYALPHIRKAYDDGNGASSSTYVVTNLGGAVASVTVDIYDSAGALVTSVVEDIAAGEMHAVALDTLNDVPEGFIGSALVSAYAPLAVQVNWGAKARYNGIDTFGNMVRLPLIARSETWNTAFSVQNVGETEVMVQINYRDANGDVISTDNGTIAVNAARRYEQSTMEVLGNDFVGAAEVNGNQPLAVVVDQYGYQYVAQVTSTPTPSTTQTPTTPTTATITATPTATPTGGSVVPPTVEWTVTVTATASPTATPSPTTSGTVEPVTPTATATLTGTPLPTPAYAVYLPIIIK